MNTKAGQLYKKTTQKQYKQVVDLKKRKKKKETYRGTANADGAIFLWQYIRLAYLKAKCGTCYILQLNS